MLVLRPWLAGFIVAAAVSDAAHLRQGQRRLQTYTQSDDYFSVMLDRVNQARAAEGLPALCTNKKLQNAAQEHSDDQAANNYLDHEGTDGTSIQDRVAQAGYDWTSVAENIAAGQPDVDSAMNTWMNSPGHRENILGDYTNFGVAYAYNANSKFQHYWTQDFGTGDAEECDGASGEPENKIADLIASSEVLVTEDPPLMATATETLPQSEGSWSSSQETDVPVVVEDPIAMETLSGTEEEGSASQWTDAPAIELPEATPVMVVDPPEIGTPASEKMYKTHDTPSVKYSATSAPHYKHEDCDSVNAVGLPALCSNKKLLSSAQRHSDDMAAKDYMEHDGSDGSTISERIAQAGYDWSAVAENVAAGQADVDAVMDAWMNSPEHKVNILGPYTMLGTAYAYKQGNTYEHFWTQDFGSGDKEVCDSTPSTDSYNQDQVDQSAVETPVPKTAVHVTETPETDPPCPNEKVTEAPKSAPPCPEEAATDTSVLEATKAPATQGYKYLFRGIFG